MTLAKLVNNLDRSIEKGESRRISARKIKNFEILVESVQNFYRTEMSKLTSTVEGEGMRKTFLLKYLKNNFVELYENISVGNLSPRLIPREFYSQIENAFENLSNYLETGRQGIDPLIKYRQDKILIENSLGFISLTSMNEKFDPKGLNFITKKGLEEGNAYRVAKRLEPI